MIITSVSFVEWHWMGRRWTFLWKHVPALFVHCGTSSMMPAPMGNMTFSSGGIVVWQKWDRGGCASQLK